MTRKRSLSKGLFGMAPAIVDAALAELSPEQRDAITASQAQRIIEVAATCAGQIGRILEGDQKQAETPIRPAGGVDHRG